MGDYDLLLKNGEVIDPLNKNRGIFNLAIKKGKIYKVTKQKRVGGRHELDLEGLLVLPGLIDIHSHLGYVPRVGYRWMVEKGVTTALDLMGPIEQVKEDLKEYGYGLKVGVLQGLHYAVADEENPKALSKVMASVLAQGALGIKIFGGHKPFTPDFTERIINEGIKAGLYVAVHAGSKETGSHLEGVRELVRLTGNKPIHLAHINAYCRGLYKEPLEELKEIYCLLEGTNIVTESHLFPYNVAGKMDEEGSITDPVLRNCLKIKGYPLTDEGIRDAVIHGDAGVVDNTRGCFVFGEDALKMWGKQSSMELSFKVNLSAVRYHCAVDRDPNGNFRIHALTSDGGSIPRNEILRYAFSLVNFGAMTLEDFVWKSSAAPARILGLEEKGHLTEGGEADITVVAPDTGECIATIIDGEVRYYRGKTYPGPGKLLATVNMKRDKEHLFPVKNSSCRYVRRYLYFDLSMLLWRVNHEKTQTNI